MLKIESRTYETKRVFVRFFRLLRMCQIQHDFTSESIFQPNWLRFCVLFSHPMLLKCNWCLVWRVWKINYQQKCLRNVEREKCNSKGNSNQITDSLLYCWGIDLRLILCFDGDEKRETKGRRRKSADVLAFTLENVCFLRICVLHCGFDFVNKHAYYVLCLCCMDGVSSALCLFGILPYLAKQNRVAALWQQHLRC